MTERTEKQKLETWLALDERDINMEESKRLQRVHFKAAIDATIERCAQEAKSFGGLSDNLYANKMVEDIVAAIRALKDKP